MSAEDGHLERLWFGGGPSIGLYDPHGLDLRLSGSDGVTDRVVHAHEAHHAALNDATAWGAALHISARYAPWRSLFVDLLNACRLTHESFATYMSINVVSARFTGVPDVLHQYPEYRRLYQTLAERLAVCGGPHRAALAATAVAWACMSWTFWPSAGISHPGWLQERARIAAAQTSLARSRQTVGPLYQTDARSDRSRVE